VHRREPESEVRILVLGKDDEVRAPIILCARQAWLQPTHRHDINDKRLRLLLVPFTSEEPIATIDRAIDEAAC
jgi:predicted neuraminidase